MTDVEAVALRVSLKGVEEAVAKVKVLEREFQALGAKIGTQLVDAGNQIAAAHKSIVARLKGEWSSLIGIFRGVAFSVAGIGGAFAGVLKTVKAFDEAQGFNRMLKLNLGDAEGERIRKATERLSIQQGVPLQGARAGVAGMVGAGVQQADQTFLAFLALAAKGGATGEQTSRGLEQLAQIASQGKLQGDELRQIQENLIPLRKLMMDAGMGGRIGSTKNPITFEEIQRELLKVLADPAMAKALKDQAAQASNSWQAAMNAVRLEFVEPLGREVSPVVKSLAKDLGAMAKQIDVRKVGAFVKDIAQASVSIGRWLVENKELIVILVQAKLATSALRIGFGTLKDLISGGAGVIKAFQSLKTLIDGWIAAKGIKAAMGASTAGAAIATDGVLTGAGAGAGAVAGANKISATAFAGAAVFAAAYELTTQLLDSYKYQEKLAGKFEAAIDTLANIRFTEEHRGIYDDWKKRHGGRVPSPYELNEMRLEWQASGNAGPSRFAGASASADMKPARGITRAERNAAMAFAFGSALR